METAIVSLICIAVILTGGLMMAQSAVLSADQLSVDWKAMERRSTDIGNTIISATGVVDQGNGGFDINVRNTGQRVIGHFSDWDVIVQYYEASGTYAIKRLSYVTGTSPSNNQWAVNAIKRNGATEVYAPGLLDPREDLTLRLKPNPPVGPGKTILVIISTDRGVTTSIQYTK
ncbi:MAG: hypothetical protein HY671_02630 [Chloroflexi bacterium]|nr:hypothetical protein [Chloroflexota bacterium]